jgi:hypothetical protein
VQPLKQQQQGLQRQPAAVLPAADDSAYASSAAATARAQAAASPFASVAEEVLQQKDTLQMVQVTDIFFPAAADSEGANLQEEPSVMGALPRQPSAAGVQPGLDRSAAPSPSESSSAAASQLVSRQSSGRALLAGRHVDSSSSWADLQEAAVPQQQQHGSRPFGFLHKHGKGKAQPLASEAQAAPSMEALQLESADGAVASQGGGKVRRRRSGCWRRLEGSSDSGAGAVSFEIDIDAEALAEAERQEQRQRRAKQRAAERAAAALAAEQLGADVEWWQHKTGDVLLDRHVARVDMTKELGSAGARCVRTVCDTARKSQGRLAPLNAYTCLPTSCSLPICNTHDIWLALRLACVRPCRHTCHCLASCALSTATCQNRC